MSKPINRPLSKQSLFHSASPARASLPSAATPTPTIRGFATERATNLASEYQTADLLVSAIEIFAMSSNAFRFLNFPRPAKSGPYPRHDRGGHDFEKKLHLRRS